jgi:hypothetical protein
MPGVALLLALASPECTARADFITLLSAIVSDQGGGLYRYEYTLTNDASSTLSAVEFTLQVSAIATLTDVTGPTGWEITYTDGDPLVDFASPAADSDIVPGGAGIFSFSSPLGPSPGGYSILGLNETTIELGLNRGTVDSPIASALPEPSPLFLLGTGVLGLIGYVWRRRQVRSIK